MVFLTSLTRYPLMVFFSCLTRYGFCGFLRLLDSFPLRGFLWPFDSFDANGFLTVIDSLHNNGFLVAPDSLFTSVKNMVVNSSRSFQLRCPPRLYSGRVVVCRPASGVWDKATSREHRDHEGLGIGPVVVDIFA